MCALASAPGVVSSASPVTATTLPHNLRAKLRRAAPLQAECFGLGGQGIRSSSRAQGLSFLSKAWKTLETFLGWREEAEEE